jgi:tRNA (guanine10-N2)-dimethyltransferase
LALQPPNHRFIYTFNYDYHYDALCKLESRQLWGTEEKNKLLISNIEVEPSISPFIKSRLDIMASSPDYSELLHGIQHKNIQKQGFTVEYIILDDDSTPKAERREKLKAIGYCIEGIPDFKNPSITYGLAYVEHFWYFGIIKKENRDWHTHRKKPHSFSNSIGMTIAKTLVSMASKGNKASQLLDGCCGVGTVLLEACISKFPITGCDISGKAYESTRKNLAFYNYSAPLYHSDISELKGPYDAAILDLPYNLYSRSNDTIAQGIIAAAARLTGRLVIVSISDIKSMISTSGLKITDFATVGKRGRSDFERKIWICETNTM